MHTKKKYSSNYIEKDQNFEPAPARSIFNKWSNIRKKKGLYSAIHQKVVWTAPELFWTAPNIDIRKKYSSNYIKNDQNFEPAPARSTSNKWPNIRNNH